VLNSSAPILPCQCTRIHAPNRGRLSCTGRRISATVTMIVLIVVERGEPMRVFRGIRFLAIILVLGLWVLARPGGPVEAARHHFYVGTITRISSGALTIHSKSHNTNFTFTINSATAFLHKGQAISRGMFRVGSYVTVSYSPGPHNSMIAYHISLRR